MSKTYRAGLVGCGGMGRHHLRVLNELPEFELVALCDIFPDAVNKSGDEYGVEARYLDFNQMYDEANLDLVTVATQTRGHHGPAVAALQRGISVLCEKPIAIDLVEADDMVAAAERSGAKFSIHQQNHVNPGIRKGAGNGRGRSYWGCYLGAREKQSRTQEWERVHGDGNARSGHDALLRRSSRVVFGNRLQRQPIRRTDGHYGGERDVSARSGLWIGDGDTCNRSLRFPRRYLG